MPNHLSLKDFLLIAEAVLQIPYTQLEHAVCIFRVQSSLAAPFMRIRGTLYYEDPVEQAAICAMRLIHSQPLPRGNNAVAYECMREMLVCSGRHWSGSEVDADEIADTLKGVQEKRIGEREFVAWVRERVRA